MADIARLHGDLLAAQAFQRLEFRLADEAPAAVAGIGQQLQRNALGGEQDRRVDTGITNLHRICCHGLHALGDVRELQHLSFDADFLEIFDHELAGHGCSGKD